MPYLRGGTTDAASTIPGGTFRGFDRRRLDDELRMPPRQPRSPSPSPHPRSGSRRSAVSPILCLPISSRRTRQVGASEKDGRVGAVGVRPGPVIVEVIPERPSPRHPHLVHGEGRGLSLQGPRQPREGWESGAPLP